MVYNKAKLKAWLSYCQYHRLPYSFLSYPSPPPPSLSLSLTLLLSLSLTHTHSYSLSLSLSLLISSVLSPLSPVSPFIIAMCGQLEVISPGVKPHQPHTFYDGRSLSRDQVFTFMRSNFSNCSSCKGVGFFSSYFQLFIRASGL